MARRPRIREREFVRISDGHTLNHRDEDIDVSGFAGDIDDSAGYENSQTGEHMVGVKLDGGFGGGYVTVPESRLESGRSTRSGFSRAFAAGWERIFGSKGE